MASGSLTHNLSYFRECFHRAQEKSTPPDWALTFNEVAIKAISPATETQMKKSILGLFQHPLCPQNHPTTEHLMPFVVASGAASLGY